MTTTTGPGLTSSVADNGRLPVPSIPPREGFRDASSTLAPTRPKSTAHLFRAYGMRPISTSPASSRGRAQGPARSQQPDGHLKIEQRQPKSGKWITTDDYPRRPDTLGFAGVEFTQEGGPPRQTRAARPPHRQARGQHFPTQASDRGDAMPIARLPKATFSPRAASSTSEARETHSWEAER